MSRNGRCTTWTRAPSVPPPPPAPPPARKASLQWRRPAAVASAAPGPPFCVAPAAPPQAPPQPQAAAPERAYRRAGHANNALVRAVNAPAAVAATVAPRAARYTKPNVHSLLRSLPAGASTAPAAAPRRVAAGRVRKPPLARTAPRVRLLSPHERSLVVRPLRGQQNCALLYRRTGGGFVLRREGVRGGAGGAHMTWTSRAQPRLRAAAAGAAARAAASVTAQPPQLPPRARARPAQRKSAVGTPAVRGAPIAKSLRTKTPGCGTAPQCTALHLRALCLPFCRTGRCRKPAGACPLRHDADKVAVCHRWLKGACADAACPLTHKVIPARLPVCHLFLEGRCSAPACPYPHIHVSPATPVCTAFVAGFCPRGLACTLRHSLVCPALLRDGGCANRERCRFHHPPMRKRAREAAPVVAPADEAQQNTRPRRSLLVPSFARTRTADAES